MARVEITHQYADGDVVNVIVRARDSYPDALDEARTHAVRALSEILVASMALQTTATDEQP